MSQKSVKRLKMNNGEMVNENNEIQKEEVKNNSKEVNLSKLKEAFEKHKKIIG